VPVVEQCLSCKQSFHSECQTCSCCDPAKVSSAPDTPVEAVSFSSLLGIPEEDMRVGPRTRKADEDVRDPKSTGRKRAALEYPLDLEAACEWRGLLKAGGGKFPIIGCINGLQRTRHHGPNKDTLHNEKGNVSRICFDCHARWHFMNDASYSWDNPDTTPIDFESKASPEMQEQNEQYWSRNKPKSRGPNSD
jgi:hypothetical protein